MIPIQRALGWIVTAGAVGCSEVVVLACPVCFRMEDGPMASGVRAAVLVLVGVTSIVLVPCAVFIAGFARRASARHPKDPQA